MTRGREANHGYVVTEANQTSLDVLTKALAREWIDQSESGMFHRTAIEDPGGLQRLEIVTEVGISHPDFIDLADSVGPFLGTVLASFGCRRLIGLVKWGLSSSRFDMTGGVVSTTGWIILIVVLLILFGGGFGWSRRRR